MATTQEEIDIAMVEIGSQFKQVKALIGVLANLSTAAKSDLVAAINEVNGKLSSAGAVIDDSAASTSKVYSSSKTQAQIESRAAALKAEILGGAGATVDTLKEIADLLVQSDIDDDNAIAALTTALGNRVRFDTSQTLTTAQKAQGNSNLGSVSLAQFGDPAHSYRAVLLTAMS